MGLFNSYHKEAECLKCIKLENTGRDHDIAVKFSGKTYIDLKTYAENYYYTADIIAKYILVETNDIELLDTINKDAQI